MTPGANFKMSRAVKTALAFNHGRANAAGMRQALIQAELHSRVVIKSKRGTDNNDKP